jgi:hypothetical protein
MRLLLAAMWFCNGAYGIYTFVKYRTYVDSLPASEGNEALKRKHKTRLLWSLACVGLGV